MKLIRIMGAALLTACAPGTAHAGELFAGLHVHDVKTPLDESGLESGVDFSLGYRGGRMFGTIFQPYVFGALNSAGNTNYAAAGVSARFGLGHGWYVRPGLGVAGIAVNHAVPTGPLGYIERLVRRLDQRLPSVAVTREHRDAQAEG